MEGERNMGMSSEEYEKYLQNLTLDDYVDYIRRETKLRKTRRERDPAAHKAAMTEFAKNAGIYIECSFDNYRIEQEGQRGFIDKARQYAAEIDTNVRHGGNVVFSGDPGAGKDHMCMAMAKAVFAAGWWVKWFHGPELRDKIMPGATDAKLSEAIRRELTGVDVLWISDPVVDGDELPPFVASSLHQVFEDRKRMGRPIWITVNAEEGGVIAEKVGVAAYDRVRGSAIWYKCQWTSARKPRG